MASPFQTYRIVRHSPETLVIAATSWRAALVLGAVIVAFAALFLFVTFRPGSEDEPGIGIAVMMTGAALVLAVIGLFWAVERNALLLDRASGEVTLIVRSLYGGQRHNARLADLRRAEVRETEDKHGSSYQLVLVFDRPQYREVALSRVGTQTRHVAQLPADAINAWLARGDPRTQG